MYNSNNDNLATIVALRIAAFLMLAIGANAVALGLALLIHSLLIGYSPGAF